MNGDMPVASSRDQYIHISTHTHKAKLPCPHIRTAFTSRGCILHGIWFRSPSVTRPRVPLVGPHARTVAVHDAPTARTRLGGVAQAVCADAVEGWVRWLASVCAPGHGGCHVGGPLELARLVSQQDGPGCTDRVARRDVSDLDVELWLGRLRAAAGLASLGGSGGRRMS